MCVLQEDKLANRFGIRGRTVDLYVRFTDEMGNPANTDETPTVTITDQNGVVRRAASNIGVSLVNDNQPGLYRLSYDIPEAMPDGYATDTWTADIGETSVTNSFEFNVLTDGEISQAEPPTFDPGDDVPWNFTKEEAHGINILLKMVKPRLKSDGTRKIRSGNTTIDAECNIFTDAELITFLVNSLSEFNAYPHFTSYTFADEQISGIFADIIVQGAVLLALAAQTLIERGREFSITDAGVTYQPPAVSEILNSQFTTQLADYKEKLKAIKTNLKPAALGLGSWRITSISPNFLRLRHLRARQII